jgi:Transposase, Mutator family
MGGKTRRPKATEERRLHPESMQCAACEGALRVGYTSWRKVATLEGVLRLKVSIGRCENRACARYHCPTHPLEEGRLALPHYEYGLDVLAFIGAQRYQRSATVAQIHAALQGRAVQISPRNVQYLLERYDELAALRVRTSPERCARLAAQGRLILAIDGLQPDVGHEVLWVIREVLSGEVLLARSLLSSRQSELAALLREATEGLRVPVAGVVSDGQQSIVKAVAEVFPGVPHQLCQFHYLRQAAGPAWEADRHAKKELKKRVRGIRPLERAVSGREDAEAVIVQGYCAAVRGALSDEGKSPLEPGGLRLQERLELIARSLHRAEQKRGACPSRWPACRHCSGKRSPRAPRTGRACAACLAGFARPSRC